LARRGLKPEGKYTYGNEYVTVTDVMGDNVLLGKDGKIYFIDPIIGFKKPAKEVIDALSGKEEGAGVGLSRKGGGGRRGTAVQRRRRRGE
jgi:hypothetical protein